MGNILFETESLIVRKLSLDDVELLFKYSQEEIVRKELPDEVFESIIETKKAIEYFMSNYDNKYPLVYGIILKTKNIIMGYISLNTIDRGIENSKKGKHIFMEGIGEEWFLIRRRRYT